MTDRPVAIVTGASRGIGKAIAMDLAAAGFDIVLNHCSENSRSKAMETKQEIQSLYADCQIVRADIALANDRNNLVETTEKTFGRCDLLVNNAGVAPANRTDILQTTEESFDRVIGINLKGPYFLSQIIANWMIRQKKSHPDRAFRIVNISSVSAYASSPFRGEYCISKAGISMMTSLYADRLAEHNIGVYEIRPGIIQTDMTSVVKDKYGKLIAQGLTPIKRWGQPEDVAKAVGAIAQGKLDFSTGEVINVDGGFHMRRL